MPVQMIGDILPAELSHMQAYIRFCSCQLSGATLLQQRTDEDTEFKDFLKVSYLLTFLSTQASFHFTAGPFQKEGLPLPE